MVAKLMMMDPVSAVPPAALWLATLTTNDPFATVTTDTAVFPPLLPDWMQTLITSPIIVVVLVTVKLAEASAASDVVSVVIWPQRKLRVTPVDRLVVCVTAPPTGTLCCEA